MQVSVSKTVHCGDSRGRLRPNVVIPLVHVVINQLHDRWCRRRGRLGVNLLLDWVRCLLRLKLSHSCLDFVCLILHLVHREANPGSDLLSLLVRNDHSDCQFTTFWNSIGIYLRY